MADIAYLALLTVFAGLMGGLVVLCERLAGGK